MKALFKLFFFATLIGFVSVGAISCKDDDDPAPEIVENPLDETAYYIVGKVTDKNAAALPEVTVRVSGEEVATAQDGTFQLKVKSTGDHDVVFEKTDYVSVTSAVTIDASAKKNSSVGLALQLTKKNPAVMVSPDADAVITEANNPNLSVSFPAGAVTTATPISITQFTEGAKAVKTGDVRTGLVSINCDPTGLTFAKPATVGLQNPIGGNAYFSELRHYVESNGQWVDRGAVGFDNSSNSYSLELTGFSNHSISFIVTQTINGSSSEALPNQTIDNLGQQTALEAEVTAPQKFGWEIDGSLNTILSTALPTLSTTEVNALASTVASSIASLKGSAPGVTESVVSFGNARVSGDTALDLTFTSNIINSTSSFSLIYNGEAKQISIPLKTYAGTNVEMTYRFGESRTDHSGGSGN